MSDTITTDDMLTLVTESNSLLQLGDMMAHLWSDSNSFFKNEAWIDFLSEACTPNRLANVHIQSAVIQILWCLTVQFEGILESRHWARHVTHWLPSSAKMSQLVPLVQGYPAVEKELNELISTILLYENLPSTDGE
ncbi:MAG: hypothetical protein SFZ02_12295 [bacterium]|nr:hypothetical protein [bacterium]